MDLESTIVEQSVDRGGAWRHLPGSKEHGLRIDLTALPPSGLRGCTGVTVARKTVKEPSITKLLVLVIIVLIAAVSVIQGSYLPGMMGGVGVLLLYYFATWVRQSEAGRSRLDLLDERLVELEKRVRKIEEGEGK
jgi:hypothetical protein